MTEPSGGERAMRSSCVALMGLVILAVTTFLGTATGSATLFNDIGIEAYGLQVVFNQPVTVVRHGEGFANWTSEQDGLTIVFTEGVIAVWGDFYFFWEPNDAQLVSYQWLLVPLGPSDWTVLLDDTFEDGDAVGWDLGPGWQVTLDDGNCVLAGEGHTEACFTHAVQLGVIESFECRFNLLAGQVHVEYRLSGVNDRYFVRLGHGEIALLKSITKQPVPEEGDPCDHVVLSRAKIRVARDTWYTLRIVGIAEHLKVYVNGELQIEYTDQENPYLTGSVGFETLDDSHMLVDDVVLMGQPPSAAIESRILSGDETWSGIVQVMGDIIVPEGATLRIEPGTIVQFAHNREEESQLTLENYYEWPKPALYVFGTLLAVGSPDRLICFTSDAAEPRGADWRGIMISAKSSYPADRSIITYAIVEYAHKSILFDRGSATMPHLVENCILRSANHIFRKKLAGTEFEGGSAITHWDASSPIVRGNIMYSNTHAIEAGPVDQGAPVFEDNIVCFNQKRGNYYGGANGVRTWGRGAAPVFRNNLFYSNWWGMEFNWGSRAVVENNIISGNDVGLVICQGDPGETESHPVCRFNNVWGNDINFMHDRHGRWSPALPARFGSDNVSIDPLFSEQDFYNANFDFRQPGLKDAGNPDLFDADGSRSDIGPNWDWSWVDSCLLVRSSTHTGTVHH